MKNKVFTWRIESTELLGDRESKILAGCFLLCPSDWRHSTTVLFSSSIVALLWWTSIVHYFDNSQANSKDLSLTSHISLQVIAIFHYAIQ